MNQSGLTEDELEQFSSCYLAYLMMHYINLNAAVNLLRLKKFIGNIFVINISGGKPLTMFNAKEFSAEELAVIKGNVTNRVDNLIEDRGEDTLLLDILGIEADDSHRLKCDIVDEIKNRLKSMGVENEKA